MNKHICCQILHPSAIIFSSRWNEFNKAQKLLHCSSQVYEVIEAHNFHIWWVCKSGQFFSCSLSEIKSYRLRYSATHHETSIPFCGVGAAFFSFCTIALVCADNVTLLNKLPPSVFLLKSSLSKSVGMALALANAESVSHYEYSETHSMIT